MTAAELNKIFLAKNTPALVQLLNDYNNRIALCQAEITALKQRLLIYKLNKATNTVKDCISSTLQRFKSLYKGIGCRK